MSLPAVPDSFEWREESWGAALRCTPLQTIAPHLFTTRQLALSSQRDWDALAAAVGARGIQMGTQVHGREALVVRRDTRARASSGTGRRAAPETRPEADILVSNDPGIAVAVRAADCVPILIGDPQSRAVAAVHAGWRGTAAGAASAAVAALTREFGARPADLVAALGPSIGPCCYEVGSELVDAFAAAGHARDLVDRWFVSPPPRRGSLAPPGDAPRLRLDTWAANRDQLVLAGLDEQSIHTCGLCTASHLELFPSYRVEGRAAGRIAGVIRSLSHGHR
jgi:YfiH family protein